MASLRVIVASAGAALLPGPARAPSVPVARSVHPSTLTVFAAASLTDAFRVIGAELERSRPGIIVQFNFAGSQQLALQMEQGAEADVFASADQRWMTYAKDHDFVAGEARVFARNRLVVIVPRTNPARIGRLEDVTRRGVKLVVAAEAVPAGWYTREVFANLGAAPGFPPDYGKKALANVVSEEDNVKAVVAKVQLGEADAGVVYRSDVTSAAARHLRVIDIPAQYNVLASYPIAVVRSSANAEVARAFIDLVRSPKGQSVLAQYGFLPAGEAAPLPTARP